MLTLHDFRKSYNGRTVLAVGELQLDPGVYWLQGPNGAGKSTLLRSIAGLIPYEGRISIDGIDARRDRISYCRRIGWAEAEPQYPAFLSGNDLLYFYGQTRGGAPGEEDAILAALGASAYRAQKTGTWSSGMLKKLSLALAFLGSPRWILLDEPLITLDAAAQEACLQLIAHRRAGGTSFLLTSHQSLEGAPFRWHPLALRDQTIVRL